MLSQLRQPCAGRGCSTYEKQERRRTVNALGAGSSALTRCLNDLSGRDAFGMFHYMDLRDGARRASPWEITQPLTFPPADD